MKKNKTRKYKVVPLDLPLDVYKMLKKIAKITNLTTSKVVNVLLVAHIVREEHLEKK